MHTELLELEHNILLEYVYERGTIQVWQFTSPPLVESWEGLTIQPYATVVVFNNGLKVLSQTSKYLQDAITHSVFVVQYYQLGGLR